MKKNFHTISEFKNLHGIKHGGDFAKDFFDWQIAKWEFAKKNYGTLQSLKVKHFYFPRTSVSVQYNPHRVGSTLALVDEASIAKRKCFLCDENLHNEQDGIKLTENYTLLVNPFPIIPVHFTAKFNQHLPQKISDNFIEILEGAKTLGENYFLLYNGPEAGASVPEHRHFQGGTKKHFPILKEIAAALSGIKPTNNLLLPDVRLLKEDISGDNSASLFAIMDGLRNYFVIKGNDISLIEKLFFSLFDKMTLLFPSAKETKLNLISTIENGEHVLVIFPRAKHRPHYFYAEGEDKLLVSPATLDFGGIMVLPREEDYRKINTEIIKQIYSEVGYGDGDFHELLSALK
jgi:hypothetical protein